MLENEKTNEKAQHGGGIIAKTLVVAVGNGAGNIVDEARRCNEVNGIGFVYADTDSDCLQKHGESDAERITLGVDTLQVQDYETIVLVACLGGKVTSTHIEQVLKDLRHTSKLVSFITLPISLHRNQITYNNENRNCRCKGAILKDWSHISEEPTAQGGVYAYCKGDI
jgi:hypothetical protein